MGVMIFPWYLRIIFYPCLNSCFPHRGFNFGNYFPFFIVSWISRSWFISDSWGSFSILSSNSCFPCRYLTEGNISPLEKIHFSIVSWISRLWLFAWSLRITRRDRSVPNYSTKMMGGEEVSVLRPVSLSRHDLVCASGQWSCPAPLSRFVASSLNFGSKEKERLGSFVSLSKNKLNSGTAQCRIILCRKIKSE